MKKILSLIICILTVQAFSQNTFRLALKRTGNDYGMHTIQTSDNGFLIFGYHNGGG